MDGNFKIEISHPFEHPFSIDNKKHVFKGSGARHVSIEHVLLKIRHFLYRNDAMPLYAFLESALDILFGLNCNFPRKDVIAYSIWSLKINRK